MEAGFEAQRRIVQADWKPPVMRQYDGRELRRLFKDFERDGKSMLLMVHEGPRERVEAEMPAVAAIAGGAGLEPGDPTAAEQWLLRRNHVPTWKDILERGYVADTAEISGTWTQNADIYNNVIRDLNGVEGVINASAHSSHVYRSGINLYFSFAATFEDTARMEQAHFECWRPVMAAG
jgi:alkyldihydroxyacetonephosphate synthase